jgi:hypothetical protein
MNISDLQSKLDEQGFTLKCMNLLADLYYREKREPGCKCAVKVCKECRGEGRIVDRSNVMVTTSRLCNNCEGIGFVTSQTFIVSTGEANADL